MFTCVWKPADKPVTQVTPHLYLLPAVTHGHPALFAKTQFLLDGEMTEWCQCGAPGSQSSAGFSVTFSEPTIQQCGRSRAKTGVIVRCSRTTRWAGAQCGRKAWLNSYIVSKTTEERTLTGLEAAPGRYFFPDKTLRHTSIPNPGGRVE